MAIRVNTVFRFFLLFVILIFPKIVRADGVGWGVGLGVDLRWFDWRESRSGQTFLKESGPLTAVTAQMKLACGPVYASADVAVGGGRTAYEGHLLDDRKTPYDTDALERLVESRGLLGVEAERWEMHAGLMQRDFDRFIQGGPHAASLEERYRMQMATIGAGLKLASLGEWTLSAAVDAARSLKGSQEVHTSSYDAFSLQAGDSRFWRLSFPLRMTQRRHVTTIEPYVQEQRTDASSAVALTLDGVAQDVSARQPEVLRREWGVAVRMAYGGRKPD